MLKKTRNRKTYTEQDLKKFGLVDTTERSIKGYDLVEVCCISCPAKRKKPFKSVKRDFVKDGHGYRCVKCGMKARTNNGQWLQSIKKAAQSDERKKRAVQMGKAKIKYSTDDILKVIQKSGVCRYEGDISSPSNTIKVFWDDGSMRSIRIRRFMLWGEIPKPNAENKNKIRHEKKLKSLGLKVTKISDKTAQIEYRGIFWTQRWVNAVDSFAKRKMKKIDQGFEIQKLMDEGLSLNKACKEVGVSPATYYKRFADGVTNAVDAALSIKSFQEILSIPGAIYNRKVFEDKNIRPDIYLKKHFLIIEIDGVVWHTEDRLPSRQYHKKRKDFYQSQGFSLLVFTEKEVKEKRDIVDSMIAHKMKKTKKRIGARKCIVKTLTSSEASGFFNKNHLKGGGQGKTIGLFFEGECVSALRYQVFSNKINISRFACKNHCSVVGAYSRLLKQLPTNLPIENFVDCRHGTGEHLLSYGFELVSEHIGFEWSDGYNTFNRRTFKNPEGEAKGLKKYWDYGQLKYIKHP